MNKLVVVESSVLCVDLDGCLLRTDTLLEGILAILHRRPAAIFKMAAWLFEGRAQLNSRLQHNWISIPPPSRMISECWNISATTRQPDGKSLSWRPRTLSGH